MGQLQTLVLEMLGSDILEGNKKERKKRGEKKNISRITLLSGR
jgi:hypothetical protein